jgi:hypothetical protein
VVSLRQALQCDHGPQCVHSSVVCMVTHALFKHILKDIKQAENTLDYVVTQSCMKHLIHQSQLTRRNTDLLFKTSSQYISSTIQPLSNCSVTAHSISLRTPDTYSSYELTALHPLCTQLVYHSSLTLCIAHLKVKV